MVKTYFNVIRRLIVGSDPKDAFVFEVGKKYFTPKGELTISKIQRDENSFYFFGSIAYIVYVTKDGSKEDVMWKFFENLPVMAECEI